MMNYRAHFCAHFYIQNLFLKIIEVIDKSGNGSYNYIWKNKSSEGENGREEARDLDNFHGRHRI